MNVRGVDLIWWREGGGWHTLVTLFSVSELPSPSTLTFVLYGDDGGERARWTADFEPAAVIVVDSGRLDDWLPGFRTAGDGVLAVTVGTPEAAASNAGPETVQLRSLVDWYNDDGRLASLHNDQCVVPPSSTGPQEWTEIVVHETTSQVNSLVVVNGPQAQRPYALTLSFSNEAGDRREAAYPRDMPPFSAHKIQLGALLPDLISFAAGGHIIVEGRFESRGLFTRPYVFTEGERFGGYHGGDRYRWRALPAFAYRFLGDGEINPMAAIHRPDLTTFVNVLHSHGDLERDFWIDARLWDSTGRLVAERPRWLQARRRGLSRGAVGDLLPDAGQPFAGHIALTFSPCDAPEYPRRLQALIEYRSAGTVSRVMAWSDDWNSGVRRAQMRRATNVGGAGASEPPWRSYYRVWARPGFTTHLSLSNPGHPGYAACAPYVVRLRNTRREEIATTGRLEAQGSTLRSVRDLFPSASAFLSPGGVGVAVVESPCDLATIQLTQSAKSGAWAVEHLMIIPTRVNDGMFLPAGA
jgi:hypothetical protein